MEHDGCWLQSKESSGAVVVPTEAVVRNPLATLSFTELRSVVFA